MSKKKDKAPDQPSNPLSKNVSKGIRWWLLLLIVLLIAAIAGYFVFSKGDTTSSVPQNAITPAEPAFNKEGTLAFLKQGTLDTVRIIDIEIADTPDERSQGMMYRSEITDDKGMLFIFERSEERQFWMKNTKVSLDIMFADENFQIVTIYKHTTPYSEASLPSFKNAKYVIEVSGGFTNRYHIAEGDQVTFERENSANPA
jgi:uncharacterized membrane protein (UPF0127 family)